MDVVVIGVGTIGSAIAYELAGDGAAVRMFDKGGTRNASWASAGILAPYTAPTAWPDFAALCGASLREYIESLRAHADINPHLEVGGNLRALFDEGGVPILRVRMTELKARGLRARYLDSAQARELEPALASGVVGASTMICGQRNFVSCGKADHI
jgi:glycine/D-amino acid oxidase-like deaminating enzyme